jgi:acetate kinase
MNVLVLNAGSSSLKFDLFEMGPGPESGKLLTKGVVQRVSDMLDAIDRAFDQLSNTQIDAVGNRIVHGGERFFEPVIVDDEVEKCIAELSVLAPLHNPHNLEALQAARRRLPYAKHVAVFDTAFHRTLPPRAYIYALPYEYFTDKKIRRYGFHGISHRYVSNKFAEINGRKLADYRLITCHLGNGCSICAVDRGQSIDTSMGFTPLEGLIMGTRSGDVDAGAILHLIREDGIDPRDLLQTLNSHSGLAGLSGVSNDMRDLLKAEAAGNERAALAIDAFCYRVRKYIGSYLAAMNGADAIVFTGGIGENSPEIRSRICADLDNLGVALDSRENYRSGNLSRCVGSSPVAVWVVPTDEELLIARDTFLA